MERNELHRKMNQMSMDELADIVVRTFNDAREEAGIVLEIALSALESKMPESDFVRFCDKLSQ